MKMATRVWLLAASITFICACGGEAIIDRPDADTGSGSSGSSGSGSNGSSGTSGGGEIRDCQPDGMGFEAELGLDFIWDEGASSAYETWTEGKPVPRGWFGEDGFHLHGCLSANSDNKCISVVAPGSGTLVTEDAQVEYTDDVGARHTSGEARVIVEEIHPEGQLIWGYFEADMKDPTETSFTFVHGEFRVCHLPDVD